MNGRVKKIAAKDASFREDFDQLRILAAPLTWGLMSEEQRYTYVSKVVNSLEGALLRARVSHIGVDFKNRIVTVVHRGWEYNFNLYAEEYGIECELRGSSGLGRRILKVPVHGVPDSENIAALLVKGWRDFMAEKIES